MTPAVLRLKRHKLRRRKSDPPFLRENLAAALADGAACEVDIVFTADGHALCLHDPELDKETTGHGPAALATRAEIERLHQRGPQGRVLASAPLFLDEIVDGVRRNGGTTGLVQLDLKSAVPAPGTPALHRLGALLGSVAPAFIASGYDWPAVERLTAVTPELAAGFDPLDLYPATLALDADGFRALAAQTLQIAPHAAIYYLEARLILSALDCGVNLVEAVSVNGAEVDAWTLDADTPELEAKLRRLIEAGCAQITTNDCEALAPMVEEIAACL